LRGLGGEDAYGVVAFTTKMRLEERLCAHFNTLCGEAGRSGKHPNENG
jgi:hypothetical protein